LQIAIQAKLDLLKEKGTWELVEKLPDAIPIANRWVFIKKHDKQGKVIRYRARLMAKGCTQCPWFNYMGTFSPVVRMDTLHAILALVLMKDLKLQQMDVKGAYHNGILHETIDM
jgi:Reverse transcriptase (RNA-dependent DNA polymerase)